MALTLERLTQLIARSPDVVVATDRKGIVVYYNDGAADILGYTSDEMIGRFVGPLYPSVEEAKRVMQAIRGPDHGGSGVCDTLQTTFVSKSGEQIPVAITGTLVTDDEGRDDGSIGFAKDLREILHKDQLATLGEVAVGLSHEINNPLAVIVNQAELLERDVSRLAGEGDCSVENERIDAIRREIGRIAEILDRLSEMVRDQEYATVDYVGPAKMIDLRSRPSVPAHAREVDPRLQGLRVLIADDDLGISRSLCELLEADGCVVSTASDGLEALEKLEQGSFDVVLSDVVMPNMDGHELFQRIQERWPDLPVLMMTAFHYDKDHIIKRSRMAGLKTVIFKKPVDPAKLRDRLLEAVEQSAKD